jgi:trans-2,3-dihydro-3-hydroxyanthranilate isomerase
MYLCRAIRDRRRAVAYLSCEPRNSLCWASDIGGYRLFTTPGPTAVSLYPVDILYPPQVVSTGLPFTVTVLRDQNALRRAVFQPAALNVLQSRIDMPDTAVIESLLVALDGVISAGDTYARILLAPPMPAEDPFTGSTAGAMACYL